MTFYKKLLSLFKRHRKIAFIDGDQNVQPLIEAYKKYLANTGTETHFIRMEPANHNEPKLLRGDFGFNKIYLKGFTSRKEVVDKFIGAYIQRSISEGYDHITVISSDYDFIDIFKMAVQIEPKAVNVTFRMIIPDPKGRLLELPDHIMNIEIIK